MCDLTLTAGSEFCSAPDSVMNRERSSSSGPHGGGATYETCSKQPTRKLYRYPCRSRFPVHHWARSKALPLLTPQKYLGQAVTVISSLTFYWNLSEKFHHSIELLAMVSLAWINNSTLCFYYGLQKTKIFCIGWADSLHLVAYLPTFPFEDHSILIAPRALSTVSFWLVVLRSSLLKVYVWQQPWAVHWWLYSHPLMVFLFLAIALGEHI